MTAAVLLSIFTVLLLAASVGFFTSMPVRMQLSAWVVEFLPRELLASSGLLGFLEENSSIPPGSAPAAAEASSERVSADAGMPESARSMANLPLFRIQPNPSASGSLRRELAVGIKKERTPEPPVFPEGQLIIPSLKVDEVITRVAIRDGQWEDLESLGTHMGWLESTGRFPNDQLAMAFIGHVTLPYPGGAGPLLFLADIQYGDEIIYRTVDTVYTYQVDARKIVEPNAVESLFVEDGRRLLLITCTGYNPLQRSYDLRFLVEAKLVRTEPIDSSSYHQ